MSRKRYLCGQGCACCCLRWDWVESSTPVDRGAVQRCGAEQVHCSRRGRISERVRCNGEAQALWHRVSSDQFSYLSAVRGATREIPQSLEKLISRAGYALSSTAFGPRYWVEDVAEAISAQLVRASERKCNPPYKALFQARRATAGFSLHARHRTRRLAVKVSWVMRREYCGHPGPT